MNIEFLRNRNKIAKLDIESESPTFGQIVGGQVFTSINKAKRYSRLHCAGKLVNKDFQFPKEVTPTNG